MNINFEYNKTNIESVSGHILKGKNYRCSYGRYKSLYKNPAKGTEDVQFYNYEPKGEVKASTLILHGLGTQNIKFLLWLGPLLAGVGVNTTVLILPGNYTRVEDGSMSGKSYLYPDMKLMYQFWEHAVVDTRSTIDFLEGKELWKENNILLGYCLGGMVSSIVGSLDPRINHTLFMTTGGHLPSIIHQSPATSFARRIIEKNKDMDFNLANKDQLYKIYEKDFEKVKDMSLEQLLSSQDIHPLFKIDPISYAHLLDKDKVTFIDAYFDSTLPKISRKYLYDEMKGGNRKILPISHVNWLPFGYFLAKYILHKLNFNGKEIKRLLLNRETTRSPLEK